MTLRMPMRRTPPISRRPSPSSMRCLRMRGCSSTACKGSRVRQLSYSVSWHAKSRPCARAICCINCVRWRRRTDCWSALGRPARAWRRAGEGRGSISRVRSGGMATGSATSRTGEPAPIPDACPPARCAEPNGWPYRLAVSGKAKSATIPAKGSSPCDQHHATWPAAFSAAAIWCGSRHGLAALQGRTKPRVGRR